MKTYLFKSIYKTDSEVEVHEMNDSVVFLHSHDFWEIFLIVKGEALNRINDVEVILKEGDICFMRPEDCHSLTRIKQERPENKIHLINFSVTDAFYRNIFDLYKMDIDSVYNTRRGLTFNLGDMEKQAVIYIAKERDIHYSIDSPTKNAYDVMLVTELIKLLLAKQSNVKQAYPEWLIKAIRNMQKEDGFSLTANDIYEMSGYGKTQCIKIFKQYLGVTPSKFFAQSKIRQACMLLSTTDMSVLEISQRLYYDSISHFVRLFKNETGKSPLEYRKSSRNSQK